MSLAYEHFERSGAAEGRGGAEADAERFEQEYREWFRPLVALCRYQLRGRGDPEAVAQEAFLRAWMHQDRYTGDRPFWPWLQTIARRLCVNAVVAESRRSSRDVRAVRAMGEPTWLGGAGSTGGSAVFDEALEQLPDQQRRILFLRHVEGMSYNEIARMQGVSIDSVRGSLKRARAKFRTAYERATRTVLGGLVVLRRGWEQAGHLLLRRWSVPEAAALLGLLLGPQVQPGPPLADPRVAPMTMATAGLGPVAATTTTTSAPGDAPTVTTTSIAHAPTSAPSIAAAATRIDGNAADDIRAVSYHFTVSPSYDEDGTVFAMGDEPGNCTPMLRCTVLLRSTDSGRTWTRLAAHGAGRGTILLPPAYPRDSRIFIVSMSSLSVSEDHGATFRTLLPFTGTASLSPRFNEGDPRVLVTHTDHGIGLPVASAYRMDDATLTPFALPLPPDARPTSISFDPRAADHDRVFVTAFEAPDVDPLASRGYGAVERGVYSCTFTACTKLMPSTFNGNPSVLWAGDDASALFVWTDRSLARSTDGGASFTPLSLPGAGMFRTMRKLVTTPGGALFSLASDDGMSSRLHESRDMGATWTPLSLFEQSVSDFVALPDGALLVSRREGGRAVIRCSTDGLTWAANCGASQAR